MIRQTSQVKTLTNVKRKVLCLVSRLQPCAERSGCAYAEEFPVSGYRCCASVAALMLRFAGSQHGVQPLPGWSTMMQGLSEHLNARLSGAGNA